MDDRQQTTDALFLSQSSDHAAVGLLGNLAWEDAMSLQELAWLGTAMSGLGVILTTIYVSIQIRNNTRAVRASAFQQVVNSFAAISFDIAKDRSLSDLFLRAGRDFHALQDVERVQFSFMLLSFLRRAENVFFQSEIRTLHARHWSGIRASAKAVMASPGARSCWTEIRDRFNPEFAAFVDELSQLPQPPAPYLRAAQKT